MRLVGLILTLVVVGVLLWLLHKTKSEAEAAKRHR
jgi:hypothetical protein